MSTDKPDIDPAWKPRVHLNPVWRDRANFIIHANIDHDGSHIRREQLWARQLAENRFELCCIPFFVYDLALGDEVETGADGNMRYVVQRVVKRSNHYTFRLLFDHSADLTTREKVLTEVERLGCVTEWYSQNLLGIDAPTYSHAETAANFLWQQEQLGILAYETGQTKSN